ncbi:unnamed protein product [Ceratitis capitata]|uniref:(Mediterranean fruit fly) hypothetical protein n=1 Tax=Ceratitis capitata TaxID=7213 RepID=A0A811UPB9_CERCA|nr:unnamed protein product [Ceratitis capitata]
MHKSRRKSKLKESTTNNELQMHFNKCKWSEKRQSKAIWVEALGMYLCSICFHVSYMFQRKHLSKCGNMCGKLRLCLGANHIHTRKYISNHINVYIYVSRKIDQSTIQETTCGHKLNTVTKQVNKRIARASFNNNDNSKQQQTHPVNMRAATLNALANYSPKHYTHTHPHLLSPTTAFDSYPKYTTDRPTDRPSRQHAVLAMCISTTPTAEIQYLFITNPTDQAKGQLRQFEWLVQTQSSS